MSEEPKKKKLVFKRKADAGAKAKKPVIKLNKAPTPDEEGEEIPPTEELPKQAAKQAKPESAPTEKTPAVKDELPKEAEEPAKEVEEPVKKAAAPAKKTEEKAFKFYCVYCGQKLSASTSMTGRKISCPSCGHKIQVPEAP